VATGVGVAVGWGVSVAAGCGVAVGVLLAAATVGVAEGVLLAAATGVDSGDGVRVGVGTGVGATGRHASNTTAAAPLRATIRKRRRPNDWDEGGF
jgi:hypothetical protein